MRAACYHGPGDVRIDDVADPVVQPGDVLLRPAFNGLCGTDLHQYLHGPLSDAPLPVVVGHEFSAEVVEVGAGVSALRPGDAVAVEPVRPCRRCTTCGTGRYNLCADAVWIGLTGGGGGIAELVTSAAAMVHPLPEGVSLRDGALVEPLAVAYHAVRKSRAGAGDRAVVLGAGPIGIGAYFGLRASGVEEIAVIEPSRERRAAVATLGADFVLDPGAVDVTAAVLDRTAGAGVSVVIDSAGVPSAFDAALPMLGPGGRLVIVAAFMDPVAFHPLHVFQREVEIVHSFAYEHDFEPVLGHLAAGRYVTDGWVDVLPVARLADAYARLGARDAIKVLIDVGAGFG